MRLFISTVFVAAASLLSTGCATLFSGTTDQVTINSDPDGARILVDGLDQGTTPATISVKRPGLGDKQVTLRLDGYQDRTFTLQKGFNTVSIINIFVPVGFIVDIVTGAITKIEPTTYDIQLDRRSAYNLDELERDEAGQFILPATDGERMVVRDLESGVNLVFEQ
ncbi:MAG: PEGA domain-containing protein [Rhodothermales bacterium]